MNPLSLPRRIAVALAAVVVFGALAACGSDSSSTSTATTATSGGVEVTDVWARNSASSATNGAVYLTIVNGGEADDAVTGVSVPASVAAMAQVHETVVADDDHMGDGMMSMHEVASVPVPAGEELAFAPGGYHVMLMELASPLEEGQTFPVTLTFAEAGEVTVTATVRAS